MIATVDAYNVSLFIHISAVVVGFGATFAQAFTFPVALKMGSRHLPYVHRLHVTINRYLTTPALVLIIVTGLYQVSEGDFSLGDFWISATFAIAIVLGGLIGAYFIPTDTRLGGQAERELAAGGGGDVEMSPEYQAAARRTGIMGGVAGLLVMLAVFLMVIKPAATAGRLVG